MLGQSKKQLGFSDIEVSQKRQALQWLEEIDSFVNWKPIEKQLSRMYHKVMGRPSYAPLGMFKALLLAQWYNLSDPELEEQLLDRRSFQKFCGFGISEMTPEATSFVKFRNRLRENRLEKKLFEGINRQIEERGLLLKKGTLIDASLVASASKKPGRGQEPQGSDPEAGWAGRTKGEPVYGYKFHVGVDQGSQVIRQLDLTKASVHDSDCFEDLLSGDEKAAYADKAYPSKARDKRLRQKGIANCILSKGYRNRPLSARQKQRNRRFSKIRAGVEQIFAHAKHLYGYRRTRYRGLARNKTKVYLLAMAMNLTRMRSLLLTS